MEASMQQGIANMAHLEASCMYYTEEVARQFEMVWMWLGNLVESAEHDGNESGHSCLVRV
jgi:hypothetical protein